MRKGLIIENTHLAWLGLSKIELDTRQFLVTDDWFDGERAIIIRRKAMSEGKP